MEKNKPGFMVYKETIESLQTLSGDQCKTLLLAAGAFAFQEVIPEFTDDKLVSLWPYVRAGIIRDDSKYRQKSVGKQYGAYKTAMIKHNLKPMERDEWESLGCPTYFQLLHGEVQPHGDANQQEAYASNGKQSEAYASNGKQQEAYASNGKQSEAYASNANRNSSSLHLPTTTPTTSPSPTTTTTPSPTPPPTARSDGGAVAVLAAEDAGFLKVMKEIRGLIPQLSPLRENLLKQYYSKVGVDVCVRAIYDTQDANLDGMRRWAYLEKILKRCAESGICSLEGWNTSEEERRVQKAGQQTGEAGQEKGRVHTAEEYVGDGNFHLHRK